jgi:L-ascorbate metabolism protein UlaG (beta-lactamase superfamily)
MNPIYISPKTSLFSILKWQLAKRFIHNNQTHTSSVVQMHNILPSGECALWLGHASVWLRLSNISIIIDPVLDTIPLYKRYTTLPLPQDQLHADIILLTHAHYDHFDKPSVLKLLVNNPNTIIVAPAGFWRYLKGHIPREKCFELTWWESVTIGGVLITLTPAKHWSKRTPFDTNKALWGGYIIQNNEQCIYHSGDTAMGDHFKEIGETFEINEAFLPIGAYRPEAIMKHNHTNPPEALEACVLLGAKTLIPIHYGTFRLSDEPLDEPLEWFTQLVSTQPYPFEIKILGIGEVYRLREISTAKST